MEDKIINGRRYTHVTYLGHGVIANTYEAGSETFGRVVLKVLKPDHLGRAYEKLFDAEPQALVTLDDAFRQSVAKRESGYPRSKRRPEPSYFPKLHDVDTERRIIVMEHGGTSVDCVAGVGMFPTLSYETPILTLFPPFLRGIDVKDITIHAAKFKAWCSAQFSFQRLRSLITYYAERADAMLIAHAAGIHTTDAWKGDGQFVKEGGIKVIDWNVYHPEETPEKRRYREQVFFWNPFLSNFVEPFFVLNALKERDHGRRIANYLFEQYALPSLPRGLQEVIRAGFGHKEILPIDELISGFTDSKDSFSECLARNPSLSTVDLDALVRKLYAVTEDTQVTVPVRQPVVAERREPASQSPVVAPFSSSSLTLVSGGAEQTRRSSSTILPSSRIHDLDDRQGLQTIHFVDCYEPVNGNSLELLECVTTAIMSPSLSPEQCDALRSGGNYAFRELHRNGAEGLFVLDTHDETVAELLRRVCPYDDLSPQKAAELATIMGLALPTAAEIYQRSQDGLTGVFITGSRILLTPEQDYLLEGDQRIALPYRLYGGSIVEIEQATGLASKVNNPQTPLRRVVLAEEGVVYGVCAGKTSRGAYEIHLRPTRYSLPDASLVFMGQSSMPERERAPALVSLSA